MSRLWSEESVSIKVFRSRFITILLVGSAIVLAHPAGDIRASWHDSEPFPNRDVDRVLRQLSCQSGTAILRMDIYSRKDALFSAALILDVAIKIASNHVAGVVIVSTRLLVTKPTPLLLHNYLTGNALVGRDREPLC